MSTQADYLSQRVQALAPSMTMAITAEAKAKKAAGEDVISFSAGEPDFDTPDAIKQAAIEAIQTGRTKYSPVDGLPELKEAIAARMYQDHGMSYEAPEIAVTVGAKQALFNLLLAAVNPGERVLIPAPYWVSYPEMVRVAGGEPVIVETDAEDGFIPRASQIAARAADAKCLILNSPSNPTGAVIPPSELLKIAEVVREHNLLVITDDIYEKLIYGDEIKNLVALAPELRESTAVVNGVSKAYAMTGWRIGYVCGLNPWVRAAAKLQGQSTSGAATPAQVAAAAALKVPDEVVETMRQRFERRRDLLLDCLARIEGVHCVAPAGTFYAFVDISAHLGGRWSDDLAFAQALLQDAGIAVVPGAAFGAPGFIRLSFATSETQIETGLQRLANFLE